MKVLAFTLLAAAAALAAAWAVVLAMPGRGRPGPPPPLTDPQRDLAASLRGHVEVLAGEIGPRNAAHPAGLARAVAYVAAALEATGLGPVTRQPYDGGAFENLWVETPGPPDAPRIVVGAHYDSCYDTPGADDNASGVAAVIELARRLRGVETRHRIRLAAFANEEPPYFKGRLMGSRVMADALAAEGARLRGMISLEMLGDWRDEPGSQVYPPGVGWLFPSRGDFLMFVGDLRSRGWVRDVIGAFRRRATVPSEGIAAPPAVAGRDLSDHWSFWRNGFPAIMITDGGPFRNTRYHTAHDTPDTLDYDRMARAVDALAAALPGL